MILRDMEKSGILVCDPFLGYLVAISTTVLLDKSRHKRDGKDEAVEQELRLCYDFVRKMSTMWQSMKNAVSSKHNRHRIC
jgi:hypothetical protein